MTVKGDKDNLDNCNQIFDELWNSEELTQITKELLNQNREKYIILKKREKFKHKQKTKTNERLTTTGLLDISALTDEIYAAKEDYSKRLALIYEANKLRKETKNQLLVNKFDRSIFYVPKGQTNRHNNLFYNFVYGVEEKLAGTGLREAQFREVFEHRNFPNVISFIYPEMVNLESWNLDDENVYFEFCNGLFDFDIPQYKETVPIRLASYFYPESFIPIFKLEHLEKICNYLGLDTDAKSRGERLFAYNVFLSKKMSAIPYSNYIKSNMAYKLLYTLELFDRLNKGETYESILDSYKKTWKKYLIQY